MDVEMLTAHASNASPSRVQKRPIASVLIGARGNVETALRKHLAQRQGLLGREALDLRLIAAFDRRGLAFNLAGMNPSRIDGHLRTRKDGDSTRLFDQVQAGITGQTVVIDCTASDEIADMYQALLAPGVGVVTANKRANSRDLQSYQAQQAIAKSHIVRYQYETTVGAAIPILGAIRDLRKRGERILSLQGILSGSISYILGRMHDGCSFSQAVYEAKDLGYTESNPLEDLAAVDLSRKLLIIAREAGFMLESSCIDVTPLAQIDGSNFGSALPSIEQYDAVWEERIAVAKLSGERWVALVEVDDSGGRVVLRKVKAESILAQSKPGQNHMTIRTILQDQIPMYMGGPGAGADVTAAGLLRDVIDAASSVWQG